MYHLLLFSASLIRITRIVLPFLIFPDHLPPQQLSRSLQRAVAPRAVNKFKFQLRSFSTTTTTTPVVEAPMTPAAPVVEAKKLTLKDKIACVTTSTSQLASETATATTKAVVSSAKQTCQSTEKIVMPFLTRLQNNPNEPYIRTYAIALTAYYWFKQLPHNEFYVPGFTIPIDTTYRHKDREY